MSASNMNAEQSGNAVAIVGYSYRMPGGIRTDDDFWRLLAEREIVQEPVTERYGRGIRPIGGSPSAGRLASPWEGLIRDDGEKLFDRSLFGMSHNEMLQTDPQNRMLLSCAWETFERSGWDLHSLRNSRTGVFIGAQVPPAANWRPMRGANEFTATSISVAMLANRISYHFNLTGSSISYCTACSAGMSALHSAMNALRCGDCEQAVVGSVTYMGSPHHSSAFGILGVISPDGKCHSFDAEANGYMRSEGAFMFAIKPLAAAERDGDRIHAVVEATAVNAAGAADGTGGLAPGRYITAPTRHAQVELMRTALARANRGPGDFDYIEAHATGTVVGDRIEGNAITEAFGGVPRAVPLRVASVKSNVGHMEAAAFHCALLKVVLMMQRRTFAPISKNFLVPNPEIDFDGCPMQVQTFCEPFPERPVVVGINSFGFGGANGHCVVREYRPPPRAWSKSPAPNAGFMFPLSARTSGALARSASELRQAVDGQSVDLYTLAGNLGRRRTHFPVRTAFAARTRDELIEALDAWAADPAPGAAVEEGERRIAMVFSGQGTQWAGCGRELYDADPVFRRVVDAVEAHWRRHSDISLRDACFSATQAELDECRLAQPAIFMIQCALVELLKTWGVYPDCVIGHSSGEVAAAYACGALSLADATRLVFHRSTLQQRTAGSGRMLAIGLDRPGVEQLLDTLQVSTGREEDRTAQVQIACENSPASTTVCGKEAALRPVMAELDRRNLHNQLLPGNIAFHSSAMDPIRSDVLEALSFLDECAFDAVVPFVSSVTGLDTQRLDGDYWWSNIRQPVQFSAGMETVERVHRPDIVLEVAPHGALQPTIVQCLEGSDPRPVAMPTLMRGGDACISFHHALGALFSAGAELDFAAQYPRPEPIVHLLPGHPREEQTTVDILADDQMFVKRGPYSHGPLIGREVPFSHPLFEARFSEKDFPWLADHRVHHAAIMPAAGYIELILEALEGAPAWFEEIEFLKPCPVPQTPMRLQTALHPVPISPGEYSFTITSRPYDIDAEGELHCRGKVRRLLDVPSVDAPKQLADIDTAGFVPVFPDSDDDDVYERLEVVLKEAFQYGPHFRTMRQIRFDISSRAFLYDVEMDEELWSTGRDEGYVLCPPLLDGGLQVTLVNLARGSDIYVMPRRIRGLTFFSPPTTPRLTCHVTSTANDWFDLNERGLFTARHGERPGSCNELYDSATGALVARIEEYVYFTSNPSWTNLSHSKHVVSWQPKFVPAGRLIEDTLPAGEVEPAALIAALARSRGGDPRVCHVVELAGNRDPDETMLAQCVESLSEADAQSEYWLVGATEDATRACYDAFHQHDASLRFQTLDLAGGSSRELDSGLLRESGAEIVLLHGDAGGYGPEEWRLLRRLTVAGGLALIRHDEGERIEPGGDWTTVRSGRCTTLVQAPQSCSDAHDDRALPEPRWVLGEPESRAADWVSLIGASEVFPISHDALAAGEWPPLGEWPRAADVQAIDFFCGADPQDPTGERVASLLVAFVQALVTWRMEHAERMCRLTVVTRGAVLDVEEPRGSALWGAVRAMAAEVAAAGEAMLEFRLVDLGAGDDLKTLDWIGRCDLRERELAVRRNRLWAPRVVSIREQFSRVGAGEDAAYRLCLDNPGQVSGLQMKTHDTGALGPRDVEVEVAAAALNFRDVMVTLGRLPALAYERSALGYEVGMEAAGVVRRVGSGVQAYRAGDEVAFTKGGCIANRIVVDEAFVFAKPPCLSMNEAASSLSAYVTAYFALVHLARLREGQRVLVHSAMGGVGQAAIALARHAGAEIWATAGSEAKRERLLELGVRAAFDSHSHDWYDALMEATAGEGVDVVLNSLAGRHIVLCLQALRPGGWHCEIGKVDIYADNALGLSVFRKNLRFVAIDVDRLMCDDPSLSRQLSRACLDLLERRAVPPLPVTVFPYTEYDKALRFMMTGRHQGKLVLEAQPEVVGPELPIADRRPFLDPDATYLVTGGLGGLGLCLLPYLAVSGARHLTLMDRDPQRRRTVEWLRRSVLGHIAEEVEIDIVSGDVAREADVRRCIAQLRRPLRGVFHLAGVLDDRLLADLSGASLTTVFAPKALGALHLHRATADCALDHFVLFSSIASTFGNLGQTNYSAASAFVDGLATYRRRQGLPALSYNMAGISEAGMAARSLHALRMMKLSGLPPISSDFAIANLDYALRTMSGRDHLIAAMIEHPPWNADSPDYMRSGRLLSNQDAFDVHAGGQLTLDSVVAQIAGKVAELCGHDEGGVDEPLSSFGLTSVSVAELGAFIQTQFSYQASTLELMTTATCTSLAKAILYGSKDDGEPGSETEAAESGHVALVRQQSHRIPSVFANAPEDHFPHHAGAEPLAGDIAAVQ